MPSELTCHRRRTLIALICGLLIATVSTMADSPQARAQEFSKPATPKGAGVTYVATTVLSEQSESSVARSFTGTLVARRRSELGYKRIGRIERLEVDQGDRIHKGQVLAELDQESLKAQKDVLLAEREASLALYEELVAGPRKQTIDAERARLTEFQAMRDRVQSTFNRRTILAGSDAIAAQDIDDARHELAASQAKIKMQQHTIAELEEGTRKERIAAQGADVTRLDASIRNVTVLMEESRLVAPYDAIITARMADEGEIVQPGKAVLRIVELAPLEAWIGVPPDFCARMKLDEEYSLSLSGKPMKGTLRAIIPELDPETRTQTAIFKMTPAEGSKKLGGAIGEIVSLNLVQSVQQLGFWLPLSALTRGVKGLWSVFVVVEDETTPGQMVVKRSNVEIVQIDSNRVLITGTVQSGDRVVTSGVQRLTPGQRVSVLDGKDPKRNQE